MAEWEVTLTVTEPCPVQFDRHRVVLDGRDYVVSTEGGGQELAVQPVEAVDYNAAAITARDVLNLLLNRLCAEMQYCPAVVPLGYKYRSLDDPPQGAAIVRQVGPARAYRHRDIPDPLTLSNTHVGSAFFRAGNIATNPFEMFRNYYLAVDAVGKRVRGRPEPDRTVIEDTAPIVLSEQDQQTLASALAGVTLPAGLALTGNAAHDLNEVLYGGFRCALMHSGSDSDFVPFDAVDEEQVSSAIDPMRGLALRYARYEMESL